MMLQVRITSPQLKMAIHAWYFRSEWNTQTETFKCFRYSLSSPLWSFNECERQKIRSWSLDIICLAVKRNWHLSLFLVNFAPKLSRIWASVNFCQCGMFSSTEVFSVSEIYRTMRSPVFQRTASLVFPTFESFSWTTTRLTVSIKMLSQVTRNFLIDCLVCFVQWRMMRCYD